MDTLVTLIPTSKFNKTKVVELLTEHYRDINDNRMNFEGKATANIEIDGTKNQLEIFKISG